MLIKSQLEAYRVALLQDFPTLEPAALDWLLFLYAQDAKATDAALPADQSCFPASASGRRRSLRPESIAPTDAHSLQAGAPQAQAQA